MAVACVTELIAASKKSFEDAIQVGVIVAVAKDKGCDLIVMASHGRRGVSRFMLGSQAHEVLTHCSTPALIVR